MSFFGFLWHLRTRDTRRIEPKDVHIGDRIVCADYKRREVDVIQFMGGGRLRFMFTDDHWIEYLPGQQATICTRKS